MNTTGLLVSERGREWEESLSPSFPSPLCPVLLSPPFSRHQNTPFVSFLRGSLSCFFFSVSRIGRCRIHAYLSSSAFNLTDERDSAATENQTVEKTIQEWKTKSGECELKNQVLQERLESAMEKQRKLELLSSDRKTENEKQQEQIVQLQRMNEKLQDKVTNERELKTPAEIVQQHTGE